MSVIGGVRRRAPTIAPTSRRPSRASPPYSTGLRGTLVRQIDARRQTRSSCVQNQFLIDMLDPPSSGKRSPAWPVAPRSRDGARAAPRAVRSVDVSAIEESAPTRAGSRRRRRRARLSAGSDSSIRSAIRETSPICTIARRSVSSMSERHVANGPSNVQTSGAVGARRARRADRASARRRDAPAHRAFSRQEARVAGRDLHARSRRRDWARDRRRRECDRCRAIQLRSVSTPITLVQRGSSAIGAVGGDVPLVRAQRSARGLLALSSSRRRGRTGAKARRASDRRSETSASRSCRRSSRCRGTCARRTPARRRAAPCRRGGCTRVRSGSPRRRRARCGSASLRRGRSGLPPARAASHRRSRDSAHGAHEMRLAHLASGRWPRRRAHAIMPATPSALARA